MKRKKKRNTSIGKRIGVVLGATVFLSISLLLITVSENRFISRLVNIGATESMLFVGDIFLGRHVESLMDEKGHDYPFHRISELFEQNTYVIGNFESSIPEQHVPTPSFGFTFSVPQKFVSELAYQGISGVSLANNHSLDHGVKGYEHTQQVLTSAGIAATGHPYRLTTDDVQWYVLDDQKIGVVPLNLINVGDIDEQTANVIEHAASESDHLIVFVHWGPEYELIADSGQRALAHELVDLGTDVVIGHHPHVVQDIEQYENGIIFYSLGNFIFDQYWTHTVREGLALSLSYEDDEYVYNLIPVTSTDIPSAPRNMDQEEARQFLLSLAMRSDQSLQERITRGIITHHDFIQ